MKSNDCKKKISLKLTICKYTRIGVFGGIMYLMAIHSIKQGQMSNVNNFTTFSIEWKLHGFQLFKVWYYMEGFGTIKSYLKFLSFEKTYCSPSTLWAISFFHWCIKRFQEKKSIISKIPIYDF
jgi:hypothetical protein